jgi:hypothetical protein
MSEYQITSENTEDTFGESDDLQEAISIAQKAAEQSQAGDPVNIESKGKVIRKFVLMPDGTVAEEKVA